MHEQIKCMPMNVDITGEKPAIMTCAKVAVG
jgi:hypothetical protein